MRMEICPDGIWYHGSNLLFDTLLAGSTITQWRALAEAFSHKPTLLCYDEAGAILHNGTEKGYLYQIDEKLIPGQDIIQHPRTTMDPQMEFLVQRPLRLKLIAELPADPSAAEALDKFLHHSHHASSSGNDK